MPSRVLIVTYGNPLRSDDGVALCAADILASKHSESAIEIMRLPQLAPELSETVSHFERVIFVDAASAHGGGKPGDIRVERIGDSGRDAGSAARFSHVLTPHSVVALATKLYGAKLKEVFLVTVIGESFAHGESLSAHVSAVLPNLIAEIERLVNSPD